MATIIFETTESGCVVPVSHKLNQDDYFRKRHKGKHIMYHRLVWINTYGEIPEGYEIDHMCKNRACSNIEHLQCIDGTAHTILTNEERYACRKEEAYLHWLHHKNSGTSLAAQFGVSVSAACRWIREWKNE